MKSITTALVVLAMAVGSANAQTMPATQPGSDYPALRKRISELMSENAMLRAELDTLKKQVAQMVAAMPKPVDPANVTAASLRTYAVDELKVGVRIEDVVAKIGNPLRKTVSGQYVIWIFVGNNENKQIDGGRYTVVGESYILNLFVADGVVQDIRADTTPARQVKN